MKNPENPELIPTMSHTEIVEAAEKQALEIARREGLKIGTIVGLAGDDYSYELKEIRGDQAVIGFENEKHDRVEKIVPLDSLLDVNVAKDIAIQMRTRTASPEMLN